MSSKNMMVIMTPAFLSFTLLMVFSNFIPYLFSSVLISVQRYVIYMACETINKNIMYSQRPCSDMDEWHRFVSEIPQQKEITVIIVSVALYCCLRVTP